MSKILKRLVKRGSKNQIGRMMRWQEYRASAERQGTGSSDEDWRTGFDLIF